MSAPCPSYSTLVVLVPMLCFLPYIIRIRLDLIGSTKRLNSYTIFLVYGIIRAIYYLFYWWGISSLEGLIVLAVVSSLLIIHSFARILQAWVGIIYLASNLALSIPDKVRKHFHYVEIGISFIVFAASILTAVALNQHIKYEELVEHSAGHDEQAEYHRIELAWADAVYYAHTTNIFIISLLFIFCCGVALHYTRRALPIIASLSLDPSKKRHHRFTFYYLILAALIFLVRAFRILYVFFAFPFPDMGHATGPKRFSIDPESIPSDSYAQLVANNYPWNFWTDLLLCLSLFNILFSTLQNHPSAVKLSSSGSSLFSLALLGSPEENDDGSFVDPNSSTSSL